MKDLEQFISEWAPLNEGKNKPIDSAWLDNEKPVKTADGRTAVVLDIDMSKMPNVIKGQVKDGDKMCDYEWNDDGTCIYASDQHGNPQKPNDGDKLVKAL